MRPEDLPDPYYNIRDYIRSRGFKEAQEVLISDKEKSVKFYQEHKDDPHPLLAYKSFYRESPDQDLVGEFIDYVVTTELSFMKLRAQDTSSDIQAKRSKDKSKVKEKIKKTHLRTGYQMS